MPDGPGDERRRAGRLWRGCSPVVPGIAPALKEDHHLVTRPEHGSLATQDRRRKAVRPDQPPRCRTSHATVELDVSDVPVHGRVWIVVALTMLWLAVDGRLPRLASEMRVDGRSSATAGSPR